MVGKKAILYILLGQASLFVCLIICILLIPHFLFEANEGGISNYGVYAKTVVPYTLGFVLSGVLTIVSSKFISYKPLKLGCILVGILLIVVLLSTYPYKLNQTLNIIHQALGAILIIVELALGIWFTFFLAKNPINYIILFTQSAGFILILLTQFGAIHILFIAEMLAALSFGLLLYRTVANIQKGSIPAR